MVILTVTVSLEESKKLAAVSLASDKVGRKERILSKNSLVICQNRKINWAVDFVDELTTHISNCDIKKAFFSCCAFEDIFHCFIEDLHSSETNVLQVGLGECIHSLALHNIIIANHHNTLSNM